MTPVGTERLTSTVKVTSGDVTDDNPVNGTSTVVICFANAAGTAFTIYEYDENTANLPSDSNSKYWMSTNSITIEVDAKGGAQKGTSYVDMDLVVQTA